MHSKYSLYHVSSHNNVSLRTIQQLVDDELTAYDFVQKTPSLNAKIGNKKATIKKVTTAINMIPAENFNQPCLYHLAITGLSQRNIQLLESCNITYQDLKDFSLIDFVTLTSIGRASTYERIIEAYNALEQLLATQSTDIEVTTTPSVNAAMLIDNYINSLKPGTFFTTNQLLEAIPLITEDNVKVFLKNNLLFNEGLCYRKKYKELEYYINDFLPTKNKDVLIARIFENKTLQEIADELNLTKQAISLREKAALKGIPVTEEELLYGRFFENFNCSRKMFCDLFNMDENVYNFLGLRLKKGEKDVLDHLADYPFTKQQQQIILTECNGFINHKNELRNLTRIAVFEDVLFNYGKTSTNDNKIFTKFNEYIIKNNYDLDLAENPSALRGLGERCQYALRDRRHNYRYYDFNQLTEEEISQLKELVDLPIGIYSMGKIYNDYIEFMKSIDIKNESELHNLYKTFIPISNIHYNRMPEFSVGDIEKNEFLIHLFHEQAPIHIDDFVNYVYENYCLKKTSLKSHIQMSLSEYVSDEIIRANYEDVSDEDIAYLQSLLTAKIHTVDEILALGIQKFDNFHDKFLNNMLLKSLGYTIRSQFILSNDYGSAERFFIQEVLKNNYFFNERLPVHRTQVFGKVIYDLEKSLDLLKVESYMYITSAKLEKSGVPKALIIDFQNRAREFAGEGQYFSMALLRKKGFRHELFNSGFESIFYDRILWADSRIKTITLAAGYLFIIQAEDVSLVNFLEWQIQEFEMIDGYDLMDHIKMKYHVPIELQKAVTLLQSTDIYYSPELSKFYCDKNTFLEEIYQ